MEKFINNTDKEPLMKRSRLASSPLTRVHSSRVRDIRDVRLRVEFYILGLILKNKCLRLHLQS